MRCDVWVCLCADAALLLKFDWYIVWMWRALIQQMSYETLNVKHFYLLADSHTRENVRILWNCNKNQSNPIQTNHLLFYQSECICISLSVFLFLFRCIIFFVCSIRHIEKKAFGMQLCEKHSVNSKHMKRFSSWNVFQSISFSLARCRCRCLSLRTHYELQFLRRWALMLPLLLLLHLAFNRTEGIPLPLHTLSSYHFSSSQ